jgi:hypothetical protein
MSICKTTANSSTVGNENVVLGLFWGQDGGREYSNEKVGLQVIAEKMKICSYIRVGKNHYTHVVC